MSALVRLENLTLSYDRHPAVHHLSGQFAPGSLTAVTGPNGAGKSTLLKAIAGILTPHEGRIILEGISVEEMAYLPQISRIDHEFPISVLQMVCIGFWNKAGTFKAITSNMLDIAKGALHIVGLQGFEERQAGSLSAGQLQRALFARLIVQDAKLILLDEPFTSIDNDTTELLLNLVQKWHMEKRTVICVLHDYSQIGRHFPDCMLMARECIAWGNAHGTLTSANLSRAKTFREAWQPAPEICEQ